MPVSLIGTFCVMYLCGYTLNTISLMALIVATGFVVDDAIVVLENIMRHVERGMSPMRAALRGSREVGFTVLSMSLSLVAVFIPILLMGGVVGRLFREFAVTLSAAIAVSLVVSLTLTPMMCARLRAEPAEPRPPGRLARWSERGFVAMQDGYRRTLGWALAHGRLMMLILAAAVGLERSSVRGGARASSRSRTPAAGVLSRRSGHLVPGDRAGRAAQWCWPIPPCRA